MAGLLKDITCGEAAREPRQETIAPSVSEYGGGRDDRTPEEKKLRIISFFLSNEEYALELSDTVEVLRPRPLTEVPRTPPFIKGILSLRGEMIAVMDLKERLGLGRVEDMERHGRRVLVAAVDGGKTGLIVERFSGVREVPLKSLETMDPAAGGFLKGIIHDGAREVKLLSAQRLADISAG